MNHFGGLATARPSDGWRKAVLAEPSRHLPKLDSRPGSAKAMTFGLREMQWQS
jgi:hypothetical protein